MKNPWKVIEGFNYGSVIECVEDLHIKGYMASEWIMDIAKNLKVKQHKYPIELFRVKTSDLGFNDACELQEIYEKLYSEGFSTVSPEIAILTRLLYDEQPNKEWLRIATPFESMIDSDGIPHLPKLGKGLGMYFIETYWSYPNAIFHPHNEFVVCS
jgi:hypothetical protein